MVTLSRKPIGWGQGEENTSLRRIFSEPPSCPSVWEGEIMTRKTNVGRTKPKFRKHIKICLHLEQWPHKALVWLPVSIQCWHGFCYR